MDGGYNMYMIELMFDMGLQGKEWSSEDHRELAYIVCLGSPNVNSMDIFIQNIHIINSIPENEVRKINFDQLAELGVKL